jgi:LPXTG-site transpeptidase (sortase) family protein
MNKLQFFVKFNILAGRFLLITSFVILGINFFLLQNTGKITASNSDRETKILSNTKISSNLNDTANSTSYEIVVPQNDALSYGHQLSIPSIGINTAIYESLNSQIALDKGLWRMPEHSVPGIENDSPVVIAGHRWGSDGLSNEYRKQNLFLDLPNIAIGDDITITWGSSIYKYEVSYIETNTVVSQMDDLILVTCKYYDSDERIFVYASRIE